MFHVYWPAVASLALIVIGIIMVILMYGDKICARVIRTRRDSVPTSQRPRGPERIIRERLEMQTPQKPTYSYGHEIEV
ncbi:unnamed protein product [Allacma fusca]|uniref:Uncharacterized protein n=1 Tax=Allacma fusca TaxID=39272 RepID=A0A8J2P6J6_9HEXA|nr:unnamed protein product [Allacma fusca]